MQRQYYEGPYYERVFPGGFPGGFPSGFPSSPPSGRPPSSTPQEPPGPPPSFTPQLQSHGQHQTFAVDPGAIRGCLFRWTYIWMRGNQQFWFFPIFVGPRSIAGFRWYGRSWRYFGVDLNQIVQFQCH